MSGGVYHAYYGFLNRQSIRLQGYDYSQKGYYFVTICIHDWRRNLFGEVVGGKMVLNEAGIMVRDCLSRIPHHYPHVRTDTSIVMPNHVHAILAIVGKMGRKHGGSPRGVISPVAEPTVVEPTGAGPTAAGFPVGVQNFEPLRSNPSNPSGRVKPASTDEPPVRNERQTGPTQYPPPRNEYQHIIPGSVGSVVRGFKIGVTKWFRARWPGMEVWQRNYYDRIVRDAEALRAIRRYIRNNPAKWFNDHEAHINRELEMFHHHGPGASQTG